MSAEAVRYPKDEFSTEYRQITETGGFCETGGRSVTQLKYVLPGIKNDGKGLEYDLKTAVVLQEASIRNDLNAIWNQVTLKGIGAPTKHQRPTSHAGGDITELVFEQIGLGGTQGLFQRAVNSYYQVQQSVKHRINMDTRDGNFGTIDVQTTTLNDEKYLSRNGFPVEGFDIPQNASAVLLIATTMKMSRKQVQKLLELVNHVNAKYDHTPRIIDRIHIPHTLLDNWGWDPQMKVYSRFSSSQRETAWAESFEVPLEPVDRVTGPKAQLELKKRKVV